MLRTTLNDGRSAALAARPLLAVALIFSALLLPAQAQTAAAKADPTDPQASVPAVRHTSALARYRPLQESPAGSWQQANEKANRAGGWRAYAREKVAADDSPAPPAATASAAKGHEGHAPR